MMSTSFYGGVGVDGIAVEHKLPELLEGLETGIGHNIELQAPISIQ